MVQRKAVVGTPIVGHLTGKVTTSCQLVEKMFRVRAASIAGLVDLLNVERAIRGVRVPDFEIDGVHSAFTKVVLVRHLVRGRRIAWPWRRICRVSGKGSICRREPRIRSKRVG